MRLKIISSVLFFTGFCVAVISQPVLADDMSELKAQLKLMQQQMQLMQAKLDAQEQTLKKQQKVTKEISHQQAVRIKDKEARGVTHSVADSIHLGGVIDVIASNSTSDKWSDETSSDLIIDTFELVIGASAGDWTSAQILFLYEDDDNDHLNVDEAFITFANAEVTPFYVTAGRMYVPFGNFDSNMISDPVTLTLGETREEAVQLGFAADNGFYGSAYVFNGDTKKAKNGYSETENSKIDNYGVDFGYAFTNNDFNLDVGAGYINNIAASKRIGDAVKSSCGDDTCIKDYVGGLSLYAIANVGQLSFISEYISALDDFDAYELTTINDKKLKPAALNIEGAYHFNMLGKESVFALGYQKTKDMYFDTETTDFFEKAWLASFSVGIIDNTTLSAEWKHSDGYSKVKNQRKLDGEKYDDEDLMQIKLSYEF